MAEVKYSDKERDYNLVSVRGTDNGGLGLETWAQQTPAPGYEMNAATGKVQTFNYSGGSKRQTHELFTASELASGVATDAQAVRARLDDFLKTNPVSTGIFGGDKPLFLKPDTARYNDHLNKMTAEIQSTALERAATTVYFHDHPDRAPAPISNEQYEQSLRQMGSLVEQGVATRGTFTVTAKGAYTDTDRVNTIDKQGLHGGFSLATLVESKREQLAALGVTAPAQQVAHAEAVHPTVEAGRVPRAETQRAPAAAEPAAAVHTANEARQLAKELRNNSEAVALVEGYLDSHGGKSKNDGKIGIGERGQFEEILSKAGNAELNEVIGKLSAIKISAAQQADQAHPQAVAGKSAGPRTVG